MEKQLTAVEWLINEHFGGVENCTPDFRKRIEQAKKMEVANIVEVKIELIKSIVNQWENAPLYDILKTTLIELHQQHNEIISRCLN